jgi:general secretion pathway protein G
MKRAGFTMIELIFVIVILGILAAVAIPKLAATRDDAKVSGLIGNTRTAIGDFKSFYTSQGETPYLAANIEDVTDVPLTIGGCDKTATGTPIGDGTQFDLCDGAASTDSACVSIIINSPAPGENNITVVDNAVATSVCTQVSADPAIKGMALPTPGKEHVLGGKAVVR